MRAVRRAISIILYLLAGMFLLTWATMAFVGSQPNLSKAVLMGVMAAFSLVPLALGVLVSPGRRGREAGIVLLVAAGWTAGTAVLLVIMISDPQFMAMMPPDTHQSFDMFDDIAFGTVFTAAMGALGFLLVREGRTRSG